MRVISGSARGRRLFPPANARIRPTADRVKEALFSTLTSRIGSFENLTILDLFAGSGSLGIEALSRGAARAVFIDNHPESLQLIHRNLQLTGLADRASVIRADTAKGLVSLKQNGRAFDLILADPPYAETASYENLLAELDRSLLANDESLVAIEADRRLELQLPDQLRLVGRKVYGDTSIWLIGPACPDRRDS